MGHSLIGKELGNYKVTSLLGEGGMGAVFAGEHRYLGDKVAIKVLHGSYANNPSITQRFFQEAKSSREIGHPSIIRIFDFGQSDDGSLYLVMELLDGQSLSQVLRGTRLGEEHVAKIGVGIAEGLAAAHAKGIVHRDLKPDNIFIVFDRVKILDFGIAKVLSSGGQTNTNALLGTPKYMAPEQAKGAKFVGPHSDVYALGAILFEMICGRPPFEGSDLTELLAKAVLEQPPRPSTLAEVSPETEELILSCLEKDPAKRPKDMLEVRNRLAKKAGTTMVDSLALLPKDAEPQLGLGPLPTPKPNTLAGSTGEMVSTSGASLGAPARASRAWLVPAAVAGLLAVGGVGFVLSRSTGTAPRPGEDRNSLAPQYRDPPPVVPVAAPAAPVAAATTKPETGGAAAKVTLRVASEPSGAELFRADGQRLGVTPFVDALPTGNGSAAYVVRQPGYLDAHVTLPLAADGEVVARLQPVEKKRPAPTAKKPAGKVKDGVLDPFAN